MRDHQSLPVHCDDMSQPCSQQQGDDNPSFREMRSPRLRHTHHVLSQLRAYLSSTPDELNATLRCRDGDFLTNKTLLAAMSAFLRSVMLPIYAQVGPTGFVPEM